ncbi:hypothetical protein M422DRAFT_63678 [Sphaerobolus stellatus SS14]|nr:hypothetical protein M422DRAFT_63678 [Sphaerobolus stellatus SS14]
MATTNNATLDPLQTLQAALSVPADSPEQASLLASLRESLENQPKHIPILCTTLINTVANAADSLLKRWVLDLLHFGIAKSALSVENRTQLASQSLDILTGLIDDPSPVTVKIVIQCFASMYPLLFRLYCVNRTLRPQWEVLTKAKNQILDLVWSNTATAGVKLAALKFMQRAILVQTRGVSDPRLQNKSDPNLALCPSDHPFISGTQLETEGTKLLERIITLLFHTKNVDLLSAIINSWGTLAKLRPMLLPVVIQALASWHPRQLEGLSASSIKSVEKAIRILLLHISKNPISQPYQQQIQEALHQQAIRMDQASQEERMRREAESSRKRGLPPNEAVEPFDAKRVKLEHSTAAANGPDALAGYLANFDFTTLPMGLVADIVIANLQMVSEQTLHNAIDVFRLSNAPPAPAVHPPVPTPVSAPVVVPAAVPAVEAPVTPIEAPAPVIKEEPVDPLQMVMDDDLEYEPDRLNDQLEGIESSVPAISEHAREPLALINFQLPPPKPLSDDDRESGLRAAVTRIRTNAEEFGPSPELPGQTTLGLPPSEMWMLLLVRLVTRVPGIEEEQKEQDANDENGVKDEIVKKEEEEEKYKALNLRRSNEMRETLCNYVLEDFPSRVRLATVWMNEEWYNDRIRSRTNASRPSQYEVWLQRIVTGHQENLDTKDRTFSQFLLDLPSLPDGILDMLREFCSNPDRTQVGFLTLREFVTLRPPLRARALKTLLDLTTHPDKTIRTPAINTVKRWVPDVQPMDSTVQTFSRRLLRRLQRRTSPQSESESKPERSESPPEEGMEDGQLPQEETLQTVYLPEEITLPADKAQVLQHLELTFALTVRVPDLLDEIFLAYRQMDVSVQEAIQELITPLIRSLGPSHGKLLTLLRTFPPRADTLALRVLTIFTEHGRPSPTIVALVKSLIAERDLDARFLIPIVGEMDKNDILKHLPRIVSMLNGQSEPKNLVRSVFGAIVVTPPQTFGSVTSNLPRVRQSELLTPAELMVLLHHSEKEIGLPSAKEAISICFSMTDIFRSEILAVVMQQIMDEPVIPLLFMRTVILSVQNYKSLVGFVSTTLLSRLITKKIWTNPALWQGFIHCAKLIAPASFGALLQLPKEQLREIVDKQPALKSGLRDHVMKRAAGNKARIAGFLELFGEGPD